MTADLTQANCIEFLPPHFSHRPLVSIIVAAYGQESYINEALKSIQAMHFDDWEAIVVDDGSPDCVMEVAERFASTDSRIRLLCTSNNGVGHARNIAVAHALGRYITFLDGDDTFYPTYISEALSILERQPNVRLVYGMWEFFGATTITPPLAWLGYGTLLLGNTIHVSAVIHRADFISVGGFDTSLRSHEDWELWIRLLHGHSDDAVCLITKPSLRYRQKSISRNLVSLTSELYPQTVIAIFKKHKSIYDETFGGLVSPPLIYMGGVGGHYRWVALRRISGLPRKSICETAEAFTNLLDFVEHNNVLSRHNLNHLVLKGIARFRGCLWRLALTLSPRVSLRLFRQFLVSKLLSSSR